MFTTATIKFRNDDIETVFPFIVDPSPELQLQLVSYCGELISHIENPSEEVMMAAVENEPWSILDIVNPTAAVFMLALKKDIGVLSKLEPADLPDEALIYIVKEHPEWSEEVFTCGDFSEAVQVAAVETDPSSIKFIENPCKRAVKIAKKMAKAEKKKAEKTIWVGEWKFNYDDNYKQFYATTKQKVINKMMESWLGHFGPEEREEYCADKGMVAEKLLERGETGYKYAHFRLHDVQLD